MNIFSCSCFCVKEIKKTGHWLYTNNQPLTSQTQTSQNNSFLLWIFKPQSPVNTQITLQNKNTIDPQYTNNASVSQVHWCWVGTRRLKVDKTASTTQRQQSVTTMTASTSQDHNKQTQHRWYPELSGSDKLTERNYLGKKISCS